MKNNNDTPDWVKRINGNNPAPPTGKDWQAMRAGIFEKMNAPQANHPVKTAEGVSKRLKWVALSLLLCICSGFFIYTVIEKYEKRISPESDELVIEKIAENSTEPLDTRYSKEKITAANKLEKARDTGAASLPESEKSMVHTQKNKSDGKAVTRKLPANVPNDAGDVSRSEVVARQESKTDERRGSFSETGNPENEVETSSGSPEVNDGYFVRAVEILPSLQLPKLISKGKSAFTEKTPFALPPVFSPVDGNSLVVYGGMVLENNFAPAQQALGGIIAGVDGFHRLNTRWDIGAGLSVERVYHRIDHSSITRSYDTTLQNAPLHIEPVTGEITLGMVTTEARDISTIRHYNMRDRVALNLMMRYRTSVGRFSIAVSGGPRLALEVKAQGREVTSEGGVRTLLARPGLRTGFAGGVALDYSLGTWHLRAAMIGRKNFGSPEQALVTTFGVVQVF